MGSEDQEATGSVVDTLAGGTYMQRFGEAKAELLRRAAAAGADQAASHQAANAFVGTEPGALGGFLADYYRDVDFPDLVERSPADLAGAALAHLDLATRRPQGTAAVRVYAPEPVRDGWASPYTAIDVVVDDMPFLVDSITAELLREGRTLHLVVHPTLAVRRDVTGDLLELHDEPEERGSGLLRESWIHVEVEHLVDATELDEITGHLRRVLGDVTASYEDWGKMRTRAEALADELRVHAPPVPPNEIDETIELLDWLAADNFTFLGYREYDLVQHDVPPDVDDDGLALRAVPGTGLGILRGDPPASRSFRSLTREVRAKVREKHLLVLTKANSRATVHRRSYLDYVSVKRFDANGEVDGERRFLGLFTASAYTQSVRSIPFLRERVESVMDMSGYRPDSHNGKDLMQFLETYPRDELFQMTPDEILPIAMQVLHIQERRQVRVFLRADVYGRFVSCLVYLPRDRYSTSVRLAMDHVLRDTFDSDNVDYSALVSESTLARLHFVVRIPRRSPVPVVDFPALEARIVEATRTWNDRLTDALADALGEERAVRLFKRYGSGFPESYKEDFGPVDAVEDMRRVEGLHAEGAVAVMLYTPPGERGGGVRFKVYREGGPLSLSIALPMLQRLGADVVDENVHELRRSDGTVAYVHDFGFAAMRGDLSGHESLRERFEQAFLAVWRGEAESDGFNSLVPAAGLGWRQAAVLRAYAKYLRQAGSPFSSAYVEQCVVTNAGIATLLVELFQARHDPERRGDRDVLVGELVDQIQTELDAVASLDQDRILRSFLAVINATLRTSWYQRDSDGALHPYTAFKLDPSGIAQLLPRPLPRFEIWVYSPKVEGVHLRFGAVARGGLRWSDRYEDFRTEVLGLVKAQAVKNAVIVPTGAKGGFVVKASQADPADREAVGAEGVDRYRMFISALLDVTDNRVGGEIVPAPDVVRHDGDDPYLVVAADKGTAKFSDVANEIALERGFWLGDAFASGGSAGYDHKAMGITARGAWESVRRHFRELDVDPQSEDFTVVGIGDMSGDVFGNGMLLSEHIRLVAAFDHRHVFLDPSPDAAASFAERKRLFELPRSSWGEYDTSLISEGGGVFRRSAKSVPITPQVREALGLDGGPDALTPAELIRAILRAPVDLLWNGGIGTYVKASTETNLDVGDKSSDALRVDGADLRCRVVGEGGNLGFTQLGRIEANRRGIRINTDAIDNSAGVDTSDHEVNLKILLDGAVRDGVLDGKEERDALLAEMTGEVASLVLADNYEQNVMLGNAREQAALMLPVHQRLMASLEADGELDRALEFLPSDHAIEALRAADLGLSSPELSVLTAYVKLRLSDELLGTDLPDESWASSLLRDYFPKPVVERFDSRLDAHPLHRQIVTTTLVNDMVNWAGSTFVFRAVEETGADTADAVRAYAVSRAVFGLDVLWKRVAELDDKVPTAAQYALWLESRRVLDRGTRWWLAHRSGKLDVSAEIAHFREVQDLGSAVPEMLRGVEAERLEALIDEFVDLGAPADIASDIAVLLDAFPLLDVVEIASRTKLPVDEVARLYYVLSNRYDVDTFLTRITALERADRWAALARSSLRYDLYSAIAGIAEKVLQATESDMEPQDRITAWEQRNANALARARATFDEITAHEATDLATLSVALRSIRTLATASE